MDTHHDCWVDAGMLSVKGFEGVVNVLSSGMITGHAVEDC